MSNDCCNERPNFGHPACIEDLGGVSRFIFVGGPFANSLPLNGADYDTIVTNFFPLIDKDAWRPFPEVQNFVWTPAESQFEDASNGKKSFIKNGKISIACETWDGDATAKMVSKMQALRCAQWGVYLVTYSNRLIGSYASNGQLYPIKIDEQSIDALFQFKTDATTQKIMFNFDLARNFDVSTLYAIDGDLVFDTTLAIVRPIDFNNDLPNMIDCQITKVGTFTTTGGVLAVNDDYRQGTRINDAGDTAGNVTGLDENYFLIQNITDAVPVTPTSIIEGPTGSYTFVIPAQTASDIIEISLINGVAPSLTGQIVYKGSLTLTV